MREIIDAICKKGRGIRYVVNAVSLETIGEMNRILEERKAEDVSIVQLSVSEFRHVGAHHLIDAQNPVTIFSFTI